jgi:hypothetical protein
MKTLTHLAFAALLGLTQASHANTFDQTIKEFSNTLIFSIKELPFGPLPQGGIFPIPHGGDPVLPFGPLPHGGIFPLPGGGGPILPIAPKPIPGGP